MLMKTILVVEDCKAEQKLIALLLKHTGCQVILVDSAESAREWLQNNSKPNLIVLDTILPGINGLDFCRQLRKMSKYAEVPIVFCSQKKQDFDKFWALRQGGNAYISKPFGPNELVRVVQKYVS
jgi:twitching motility two-component system response regulator PilH